MSIFKRLSATFASRLDQVVGEIENHDAVIEASLSEIQQKIAKAKYQLQQMQKESQSLTQQLKEQKDNALRWRQRAINSAISDEEKALACIARSQQCQKKAETLENNIFEHNQAQEDIKHSIESSEQYFAEMKQKLTLMRARTSTNQALDATLKLDNQPEFILEDTFKRWEINTNSVQTNPENYTNSDILDREFSSLEEKEQLKKALSDLLNAENENEK